MARWETLKVWDLVRLILEIWRYDQLWPAWCHNALRNWSLPQHHAGYRANGPLQKCSEILKFLFSKGCLFVREIKLCTAMTNFSCSTVIWRLLTGLLNNTYKNKPAWHYLGYINIPPLHNSMCYCLFSKLYFHYSCSTHQLHELMTIVCFTCELTTTAYLTERILKYDFTASRSTMLFHSCNAKIWSGLEPARYTGTEFGHCLAWWRHQMDTFSELQAVCTGNSPVPGDFPAQVPVSRSFNVFFDLCPNKRLSKQSWGWWFETPSHPLWRHYNDNITLASNS